jgi:hypothetical protein
MPRISAWEDDPLGRPDVEPISRPVPATGAIPFAITVRGRRPPAAQYEPSTREFRYWAGLDALTRASQYWARAAAPTAQWYAGTTLPVNLDQGEDLNAYYDREGLSFFHATVRGVEVFSGESPDVLCHEHGHALLDAVRPQLWNAASLEVEALHEAFGDISAMLAALQLPSVRAIVLEQTTGRLSRASRLSRLAEQLGWAIRQFRPDAVDPDCLRNAVNSFFYRDPTTLPPMAPANSLAAESHSFSRVFTAAWLETLATMVERAGPTSANLLTASRDAGKLLVAAVRDARIASNYFAQVAAHLLRAESRLFGGRDQQGIRAAFVRRGILSPTSATTIVRQLREAECRPVRAVAGPETTATPITIDAGPYGLRTRRILVEAPVDSDRSVVAAAALDFGSLAPVSSDHTARAFVEVLLRRRRVDPGVFAINGARAVRSDRTTHALVRDGRDVRLVRRRFH